MTGQAPPVEPAYTVHETEVEAAAKQLAVDIALAITTYEQTDDVAPLSEDHPGVGDSLFRPGYWSRGAVIYPQYGGLKDGRASVMVVTRQILGQSSDTLEETTRTLDIRLLKSDTGEWLFESIESVGGTPLDRPADLPEIAVRVLENPRIWLPDSARWDIYSGRTSLVLLEVMEDLAEQTAYGVITLTNGHPHHVFGTDRQSHHTSGRAVDVFIIGETEVIHGRQEGSFVQETARWLLEHPLVRQVGGPWDLDGSGSSRSFTDSVHQDHLHIAVNG